MSKVSPPNPGKVWHFLLSSVSDCHALIDVLLLRYMCQSLNHLDVAYVATGVINRSIIIFNLITPSMKCKLISTQLVYDLFPPLIRFLMDISCSSVKPTFQIGVFYYSSTFICGSCALKDLNVLQVNVLLFRR